MAASSDTQVHYPKALHAEIERVAATVDGRVGVAAWPMGREGEAVFLNATEAFPMGSTMKLPMAAAVLQRVDDGTTSLTNLVDVPRSAFLPNPVVPGIAEHFLHPGLATSIANLIEQAIVVSDNTATDVLMAHVGGPAAVNAWLLRKKIFGQRVDRDIAGMVRDFFEMGDGPVLEQYERLMASASRDSVTVQTTNLDWERDTRDTTTPEAMATLLSVIWSGRALSSASTSFLIGALSRCRTGVNRLPGHLPRGTQIAHKTGGIGGMTSDIGVISLPLGYGDIVVVVYISECHAEIADREFVIATIGRAIYDYYLFTADR